MRKGWMYRAKGIALSAVLAVSVTACGSSAVETQGSGEGAQETQESAEGDGQEAEAQEAGQEAEQESHNAAGQGANGEKDTENGQDTQGKEDTENLGNTGNVGDAGDTENANPNGADGSVASASNAEKGGSSGSGDTARLVSTQGGASSVNVRTAFENHDQNGDHLTEWNVNAPSRSYSYWGTGLTSEEEKEMILGMNGNFKSAVVSRAASQGDDDQARYDYYGSNYGNFTNNGEQYVYTGNVYKLLLEAADAGVISREDAELCILADVLWTDHLAGDLFQELMPKLFPYAMEHHKGDMKKAGGDGLDGLFRSNGAASGFGLSGVAMPEAGMAAPMDEEEAADYDEGLPMETAMAQEAKIAPEGDTGEAAGFNTTEYNVIDENGFRSVAVSPLSTFSIDVDTAGYTKVKYDILQGNEIVKDEVKIEELINYFNFDYTADRVENEPFIVATEYTACPWNKAHKLLRIGIKADDVDQPDTNFVLVADVSGSMLSLNKLPLALNAYADMLEGFDAKDKISLMYYASSEGVLLDGVSCDDKGRVFDGLAETLFIAGGGTYGEAGLNTAYQMAKDNYIANGVNRVLLATDGDFNIGRTSSSEMKEIVEQGRQNGVYLTILGYGFENLKDNRMETMAENGHGNYYYIGDSADAKKALVDEAASTLIPVADDVKIQVEFNPGVVQEYRLIGYESRLLNAEDFNNDKVTASQIGSGKSVTALYELVLAGEEGETSTPELKYSTVTGNGSSDVCNVAVRYKGINSGLTGEASQLIEKKVPQEAYVDIPDDNTALAISLCEFGMVLRDSEYRGTATLSSAEALADAVVKDTGNTLVQSYLDLIRTLKANSR